MYTTLSLWGVFYYQTGFIGGFGSRSRTTRVCAFLFAFKFGWGTSLIATAFMFKVRGFVE